MVFPTALITLIAGACGDSDDPGATGDDALNDLDPAATEIFYSYRDSSLPPEYHRSYEITANADGVNVIVDVYGDVHAEATEAIPPESWQALLDEAPKLRELPESVEVEDSCDGGRGGSLRITDDDEVVYETSYQYCGATNGDLESGLRAYIDHAVAGVDMSSLLE